MPNVFVSRSTCASVAHLLRRLPGIRHCRYWWHRWQLDNHYGLAESYYVAGTGDDDAHLTAIWRGEA